MIYNNNIISIAKFMGIEPIKGINEQTGNEYYYYNNAVMEDYEALPTYSNWCDLMPVVEKINKEDEVIIKPYECLIVGSDFDTIIETEAELIDMIFNSVVKYIKLKNN